MVSREGVTVPRGWLTEFDDRSTTVYDVTDATLARRKQMTEALTRQELENRFDSEWVLLEDPEVDEQFRVVRGKVVFHSKDRDEVDRKAIELRLKHAAFLYTGEIPEDSVIVL
jgi:hypothetical protein